MKTFLETFFRDLGVSITSLEVQETSDDCFVRLETPDSSLMIGVHGKNREAFEHIIGRVAEKKLKKFIHVHLEVNDYLKAKDERLFNFIETKIHQVLQSGKPVQIQNLTSFDRKKAHNYIAEKNIDGLSTRSEGEAESRVLVLHYSGAINPKNITTANPAKGKISDIDLLSDDGVGI